MPEKYVHALGDLCTVVGNNSYAARRIGNVLEKAHAIFAVFFLAPPPTPPSPSLWRARAMNSSLYFRALIFKSKERSHSNCHFLF
jgi:hypothetical protein